MDLDLKLRIQAEEHKIREAKAAIRDLVKPHLPENAMFYTVGDWDCKKSPFGFCTYHNYKDPAHDNCIFCGQPDDRN